MHIDPSSTPDHHRSPARLSQRLAVPLLRAGGPVEVLLDPKQTADLVSLLGAVSAQDHLGSGYRDQAGYWASQVGFGLDAGDMQTIAWLLEDVAGSPWMA